jgi:hypothetical protein
VRKIEGGGFDQRALGADALEEHDQLQLEEDDRIDRRPAAFSVQLPRPVPDEAKIQLRLQVLVDVVGRDQLFERDGDRLVEATRLCGAEHGTPPQQHGGRESRVLVRLGFVADVTI